MCCIELNPLMSAKFSFFGNFSIHLHRNRHVDSSPTLIRIFIKLIGKRENWPPAEAFRLLVPCLETQSIAKLVYTDIITTRNRYEPCKKASWSGKVTFRTFFLVWRKISDILCWWRQCVCVRSRRWVCFLGKLLERIFQENTMGWSTFLCAIKTLFLFIIPVATPSTCLVPTTLSNYAFTTVHATSPVNISLSDQNEPHYHCLAFYCTLKRATTK